jgi:hypothetical protein
MIGERFLGRAAPGAPLTVAVPPGHQLIGVRVDAACTLSLLLDGRLASQASVSGAAEDGDMPGSGYSLMAGVDGASRATVHVSAPAGVWGMTE